MRVRRFSIQRVLWAVFVGVLAATGANQAGTEQLTFSDLMKLNQIVDSTLSDDGLYLAYALTPDRGESSAVVRSTDGKRTFRVERCSKPELAGDFMACTVPPTQKERDQPKKKGAEKDAGAKNGMALLSLAEGEETRFERVESFALSDDGRWLAYKYFKPKKEETDKQKDDEDEAATGENAEAGEAGAESKESVEEKKKDDEERPRGTELVLRELATGKEHTIADATDYSIDEPARFLVYVVADEFGEGNGIFVRSLEASDAEPVVLKQDVAARYSELSWAEDKSRLAFLAAVDDDLHEPGPADVWWWDGDTTSAPERLVAHSAAKDGWRLPSAKNPTRWSKDGERLFFGFEKLDPVVEERRLKKQKEKREKKQKEAEAAEKKDDGEAKAEDEEPYDPYDFDTLIEKRGLDVWHDDDPYIQPQQKIDWERREKNRRYLAVVHLDGKKLVRLADTDLPDVRVALSGGAVIATSNLAYRKRVTWEGDFADVYRLDLESGKRQLIMEGLRSPTVSLSPGGRFAAYWNDGSWHLFDGQNGSTRNLTVTLKVPFANEDDDYPAPDPGYGVADWIKGDKAVLIYDKYDVWRFPTAGGSPTNLTGGKGREEKRIYRLVDLERKILFRKPNERLLLHGYHDLKKNDGIWETRADRNALRKIVEEPKHFRVLSKADDADTVLFTRESYEEFPDLWVTDSSFKQRSKLSDANPELDRFARGQAELVEWRNIDGTPLQGVLIKPGNYEPGKRYPVLIYYYRFFSQRLHYFNQPVINHRPSFPIYASDGYAVFLPDVRFEIGRPGYSAVKSLVPGVQKLVDMGIADPDAIGIHGHSWSGYQTAHVITQTDMFAAAVAGAPVSNMTSAYSGIRLGSGRARQFQYEEGQSRIGGSLDEALPQYIENSPVFYARHIDTPLLIQFGDIDEAVPWEQGIELYLAMRRLDKDVIFLQYRNEPHHLKRYPNKLDYSIKMKEFFDHHLKGVPAPTWMIDGVPYKGE